MRVALVHDYLIRLGGAERVLKSIHEIFPEAPIYTLLYDPKMKQYFPNAEIKPSALNKLPKILRKGYKFLLPILPTVIENFNLRDYDLVISSSSAFAKGVITRSKTKHISYIHAPMRFAWDWTNEYLAGINNKLLRKAAKLILHYIRLWDKHSADRVDYFIANSDYTAERIKKYYKKEATVIYPPIKIPKEFNSKSHGNYFLAVSQIRPHKRIDLLIKAFNKLGLPLIIIGDGNERKKLEKIANKNIKFTGFISDEELEHYLQNCKAFIFPVEDDFGIAPVEAMAYGKPVLAYQGGGALETIIKGKNGEFFDSFDVQSLIKGINQINKNINNYDPVEIKNEAIKYSEARFKKQFKNFVLNIVNKCEIEKIPPITAEQKQKEIICSIKT